MLLSNGNRTGGGDEAGGQRDQAGAVRPERGGRDRDERRRRREPRYRARPDAGEQRERKQHRHGVVSPQRLRNEDIAQGPGRPPENPGLAERGGDAGDQEPRGEPSQHLVAAAGLERIGDPAEQQPGGDGQRQLREAVERGTRIDRPNGRQKAPQEQQPDARRKRRP